MKSILPKKIWNKMTQDEKNELINIVPLRTEENGDIVFSYEAYQKTRKIIIEMNKKYRS